MNVQTNSNSERFGGCMHYSAQEAKDRKRWEASKNYKWIYIQKGKTWESTDFIAVCNSHWYPFIKEYHNHPSQNITNKTWQSYLLTKIHSNLHTIHVQYSVHMAHILTDVYLCYSNFISVSKIPGSYTMDWQNNNLIKENQSTPPCCFPLLLCSPPLFLSLLFNFSLPLKLFFKF